MLSQKNANLGRKPMPPRRLSLSRAAKSSSSPVPANQPQLPLPSKIVPTVQLTLPSQPTPVELPKPAMRPMPPRRPSLSRATKSSSSPVSTNQPQLLLPSKIAPFPAVLHKPPLQPTSVELQKPAKRPKPLRRLSLSRATKPLPSPVPAIQHLWPQSSIPSPQVPIVRQNSSSPLRPAKRPMPPRRLSLTRTAKVPRLEEVPSTSAPARKKSSPLTKGGNNSEKILMKIHGATKGAGGIDLVVQWQNAKDLEVVSSSVLRKMYPQMLIDFYSEYIEWA